jgi:hypothetical protein
MYSSDVQVPNGKFIYGDTERDDFLAMKSVNHDIKVRLISDRVFQPLLF